MCSLGVFALINFHHECYVNIFIHYTIYIYTYIFTLFVNSFIINFEINAATCQNLPSNACLDIFPDNTLSSYLVKLERPLRLNGKWVVGMVEMHYPNLWNNVTERRIIILQGTNSAKITYVAIHDTSFNMESSIRFTRDKIQNACLVEVKECDLKIKLSNNLANILGLENIYHKFGKSRGTRMCDIAEGFSSLYVYCIIVEPQIVGDVQAQLFRIVRVKEKKSDGESC